LSYLLAVCDGESMEIPGVGPRNLRKLVEKGIGGVAELKQLYKDKVFFFFFFFSFLFRSIENGFGLFKLLLSVVLDRWW
jgi:hypothetical protein